MSDQTSHPRTLQLSSVEHREPGFRASGCRILCNSCQCWTSSCHRKSHCGRCTQVSTLAPAALSFTPCHPWSVNLLEAADIELACTPWFNRENVGMCMMSRCLALRLPLLSMLGGAVICRWSHLLGPLHVMESAGPDASNAPASETIPKPSRTLCRTRGPKAFAS